MAYRELNFLVKVNLSIVCRRSQLVLIRLHGLSRDLWSNVQG